MTIPCTESIEGLSHDNKPGKKSSSSTASNNQDSIQEPPFTIDQKTCLNSGAEMNSPFTNLDRLMLDKINLARRDPKEYSKKLKNLLHLIKANPSNNKIHLLYDDDLKIKLKKFKNYKRKQIIIIMIKEILLILITYMQINKMEVFN